MSTQSMTKYTLDVPDDVWENWKLTVPRSYDKLGDRVNELIDADRQCHDEHGTGILERLEALEEADDSD